MKLLFITFVLFATPVLAHAQTLEGILANIQNAINAAIPVLIGLAVIAFFYGLVRFIFQAGDENAIEEGKRIMLWGIISIFIMVALWGIMAFLGDLLNIGVSGNAVPPTVDCTYLEELDGYDCTLGD